MSPNHPARPRRWVLFDWGGTLMSEDGPLDLPMALWPEVRAVEGARDALAALAPRYGLAIATNASVSPRSMIEAALGRVGLREYFSEVFCYADIGARKDSDEFWRAVLERLDVEPSQVVMVGDSLDQDVAAPSRFGIHSIWFDAGARTGTSLAVPTARALADVVPMVDAHFRKGRGVTDNARVEISAYSPLWPAVFDLERERLEARFEHAVQVEHVGSTAVPGLAAKPVIDILVGAPALAIIDRRIEAMVADGYRYVPEFEKAFPQRRYFTRAAAQPGNFNVHAVVLDSPFWKSHLAFRDALRADAALSARYERLKRQLAARFPDDRAAYTEGKADFIRGVLGAAP